MRPPPKRSDPSPLRGPPLPCCAELWLWGWGAAEAPPPVLGKAPGPRPGSALGRAPRTAACSRGGRKGLGPFPAG